MQFVNMADLSICLSGFEPMRFELEPKTAALNMRLPKPLLQASSFSDKAKASGIPRLPVMCG